MKKFIFLIIFFLISNISCSGIVNSAAFFPDTKNNIPAEQLPDRVKEIFITSEDGIRLQAYLLRHNPRAEKVVIYFHGNAGNAGHRLDEASVLFNMGCDVLLLSYRGYGKSGGKPSEDGVYKDGRAALNFAADTLGYRFKKIFILGRSLGTTVAVHVSQNIPLAGIILVTPLSSGRDMADAVGFGVMKYFVGNPFDSMGKLNRITSPLLIIHGDRDEVVPYTQGLKIYNEYKGEKKMITIKNGRHNDLELTDPELYWGTIAGFLKL